MQAIETVYNGYRFRSRLEARWAVFFDAAGIPYQYEPEGFKFDDGTCYLPDFYLPEMDTYFEVKGVMSEEDTHKIEKMLIESGKPIVIGYSDFEFEACDDWYGEAYEITDKESSVLAKCVKCGRLYFMGINGYFGCRCCKHYDGDHGHTIELYGSQRWPYRDEKDQKYLPILKAKGARFEHGENGNGLKKADFTNEVVKLLLNTFGRENVVSE